MFVIQQHRSWRGHKLLNGITDLMVKRKNEALRPRTRPSILFTTGGGSFHFVVWMSDNENHKRIVYLAFFMAPSEHFLRHILLFYSSELTKRTVLLINLPGALQFTFSSSSVQQENHSRGRIVGVSLFARQSRQKICLYNWQRWMNQLANVSSRDLISIITMSICRE